jgi:hypothetical protein
LFVLLESAESAPKTFFAAKPSYEVGGLESVGDCG